MYSVQLSEVRTEEASTSQGSWRVIPGQKPRRTILQIEHPKGDLDDRFYCHFDMMPNANTQCRRTFAKAQKIHKTI